MQIEVSNQSEEYYLYEGVWEHACRVIPPKYGKIDCEVCGKTVIDDYDYSDEYREAQDGC